MAQKFTDFEGTVCADWLNAVDDAVFDALSLSQTPDEARVNIGAAPLIHTHNWADITDPPATYPPDQHTHDHIDDITNIDAADCHPIGAITDLQSELDLKLEDAPSDGTAYTRKDADWEALPAGLSGIHADLTERDAVDSHPIAAVTDLQSELDTLAQLGARKNLVINGSFMVQQRSQSSPTTSDHWMRDRWRGRRGADDPVAIGDSALGGYSMLVQRPASDSTTGTFRMNQQIEYDNFILLAGQKLTFSIRVRVEQAYLDTVPLDGDTIFELLISGGTVEDENVDNVFGSLTGSTSLGSVTIIKSDIVADTWQHFSVTTGDVLSTGWKSIRVDFQASYYGTSTELEQFRLAQVQLEASEERTSFEYRSFGEELALSQRYYWTGNANGGESGYRSMNLNSINGAGPTHSFPVTMRINPAMATTGGSYYQCSTTAVYGYSGGFQHVLSPTATHAPYRCSNAIYYADAEV